MPNSFKHFIATMSGTPAFSNAYTPKSVKIPEFIEWCDKNASSYLAGKGKNGIIYRGIKSKIPTIGKIDTSDFSRVSANTYNYYTLWIDHHHDWNHYPKRSKGLVCTQSAHIARDYGSETIIIPSDKSQIGICPEEDIWFTAVFIDMSLFDLNEAIHSLISHIYGKDKAKEVQQDYGKLTQCLRGMKVEKLSMMINELKPNITNISNIVSSMYENSHETFYDFFEHVFNPITCGFKAVNGENYSLNRRGNSEVWIEGECMVIDTKTIDDLRYTQYKDFKAFQKFLTTHQIDINK